MKNKRAFSLLALLLAALFVFAGCGGAVEKPAPTGSEVGGSEVGPVPQSSANPGVKITLGDFTGMSYNDALTAVAASNLYVQTATYVVSDKPYGTVIDQNPKPSTQVDPGSYVTLTLSDGSQVVTKPTVKEGDSINYGMYCGSGIPWIVLKVESNKILITTEYAIDYYPFNNADTDTTWETSSIRAWLNGEFLNNSFTEEERARIISSSLPAYKNSAYEETPQGKDTIDKIFLLSVQAVKKYFTSDAKRRCSAPFSEPDNIGSWWLKTMGKDSHSAAFVDYNGVIHEEGASINNDDYCVRPAMWITL